MKQFKTQAIVLSRINYQETDRIITVITPDHGKLRLMARGARSLKSKLAGGIELFSINDLSFIQGRGEVATLISSRLKTNFPNILKDINRVQLGYEILQMINKLTEDQAESDYYFLLAAALAGLNNELASINVNKLWFLARLLFISGHAPNLVSGSGGEPLKESGRFSFDHQAMAFVNHDKGNYNANHLKFLRLVFNADQPALVARVKEADQLAQQLVPLVELMHRSHLGS